MLRFGTGIFRTILLPMFLENKTLFLLFSIRSLFIRSVMFDEPSRRIGRVGPTRHPEERQEVLGELWIASFKCFSVVIGFLRFWRAVRVLLL